MTCWLFDREDLQFDYGKSEPIPPDAYRNQLHNVIAKRGQDGWEPWHMAGSVNNSIEYVTVFFKKAVA